MENLEKTEERRLVAQTKLAQATETADDAKRFVHLPCVSLSFHSN